MRRKFLLDETFYFHIMSRNISLCSRTPCKQSLCFTCSILSYSSKTHAASIEYDLCLACAACCLDTVWTSGLIAVRFLYSQLIDRLWPLRFINLKRMLALWIPVWREKTRLTSSEVRGSVSSKAWRKFSPSISKKTNEDVCSIAFVINSFNGRRFLEFTEPNWKIYCTIFLWYKI